VLGVRRQRGRRWPWGRFSGLVSEEGGAPRWDRGIRGELAAGDQISQGQLQPVVGLAFGFTGASSAAPELEPGSTPVGDLVQDDKQVVIAVRPSLAPGSSAKQDDSSRAGGADHSPRIAVRVPAEVRDRAVSRAVYEGRSLSDVVRGLPVAYAEGAGSLARSQTG